MTNLPLSYSAPRAVKWIVVPWIVDSQSFHPFYLDKPTSRAPHMPMVVVMLVKVEVVASLIGQPRHLALDFPTRLAILSVS